jgi:sortase A
VSDRLRIAQRICFGVGGLLITVWAAAQVHREIGQRQDLQAFEAAQQAMAEARLAQLAAGDADAGAALVADGVSKDETPELPTLPVESGATIAAESDTALPPPPMPESIAYDYSLWSPKRVKDYEASLNIDMSAPQALLRIPSLGLQVPVLDGIDELTLNRGVGRIPGTARPGGLGNIGIAGHRDGFFRVLKDINVGDEVELVTWRERFRYRVTDIDVVEKHDVNVLTTSDNSMITLVTCYPFYFIGHAPKRYIVKASLADSEII